MHKWNKYVFAWEHFWNNDDYDVYLEYHSVEKEALGINFDSDDIKFFFCLSFTNQQSINPREHYLNYSWLGLIVITKQ